MKNFLRKIALFNDSDYIKYGKLLGLCNYPWEHVWAHPIPLEATLDQTASWPTSVWALDEPRKITQPSPADPQRSVESPSQPTAQSPQKIPLMEWEQGQSGETSEKDTTVRSTDSP